MKALLLTNEYPPHVYGGAGVHVEYLSRELSRLMAVEVRCFGEQQADAPQLVVRGHGVPPNLLDLASSKLRSPLGAAARCLSFSADSGEADLVHCHTWYTHMGGVLCKLLHGLPLVLTTHSLEPLRPWKREQLGRGYDFSSWIERTALDMADAVIAVSQETRNDILSYFDVDPDKVAVIPNGIDLAEYRPDHATDQIERHGVPAGLPYALFVGRVTQQKGIIHLLDAIAQLDRDLAVVLLAGAPDTAEIAAEMETRVAALQQQRPHLYWIRDMVPREAAIQFYSHADVFCCPSIYEPFGIIALEAMACHTPVVASAVGGLKDIVSHEQTGLLVELEQQSTPPFAPLDPSKLATDLASAITRVMTDAALRERLGNSGRKRVEEHYSWSSIAQQVHQLYQRVVRT